ncbi:interleukin-1 receptor-like 1 [Megalops cyprinoides]|uniref:interleukin-1 receptor-like 1 n=1 Tax=Megalops cyprinoides TaxID=118141 RepID=UPI001864312D|nr:interleukin-1 receptor-like 1 [Megalops cyprinoides]XP_036396832.1 interleukin-1 receptor-like 1 [Megalops cyprinoides]XP_036396833.1 interleukin-1 receptor-like 1 [Megalops cyprinoides]
MKDIFFIFLFSAWKFTSAQTNTSAPCKPVTIPSRRFRVTEKEAIRLICNDSLYKQRNATEFSWRKNGNQDITSSEDQRIHHHGGALFFLPVLLNDTAVYSCIWQGPKQCANIVFEVIVYEANPFNRSVLYTPIEEQARNPGITCPDIAEGLCQGGKGTLVWYKDFKPIPNESEATLRINDASKNDEGIYTCKCSWEHNGTIFNTSASRELKIKAPSVSYPPEIQSPKSNATETAELGSPKTLVCEVFFGYNVDDFSEVWWEINGKEKESWDSGYSENVTREVEDNASIQKAVLTISSVSESDFHSSFMCVAMNDHVWVNSSVFLKPRETIYTLIMVNTCAVLVFVLAFVALTFFRIDLVLLFRGVFRMHRFPADGKIYDAYVIYQRHNLDKAVEEKMGRFVSAVLPDVLERKCGYRLFIHGRDDLPGEDHMELIETRMKLSRRLIVILTPGTARGYEPSAVPEDYDRQVGLHHALVQGELRVILIELEKMDSYSHLPQGLQHLVLKSAPLRWKEGGRKGHSPHSRFWKNVRYMMPVPTVICAHPRRHKTLKQKGPLEDQSYLSPMEV